VVEIQSRIRPLPERALIRAALQRAAAAEGVATGRRVSVLVCGDAEMAELNRVFAGENHATDVLSFPAGEVRGDTAFKAGPDAELELGDIALSRDRVVAQARGAGHSVERETAVLVIHGFLHLLGYDHADSASEQRMFGRTEELVASLGV
jgi:probable rRNA maturation factor